MSKEFRPILGVGRDRKGGFTDELQRLEEEKKLANDRLRDLSERLNLLEDENRKLLEEIKKLQEMVDERERRIEELLKKIKDLELGKNLAEELPKAIEERLLKIKEELKGDFLKISKEIIREFLLRDAIPKEDLLIRILKEVFDKFVDLKGSVNVVVNVNDIERVREYISRIKEKLGDKVEIEIIPSEEVSEGEVRIETPKFIIERKHGEIFEEIFEEVVKSAFKGR